MREANVNSLMSRMATSPDSAALGEDGMGVLGMPWSAMCWTESLLRV